MLIDVAKEVIDLNVCFDFPLSSENIASIAKAICNVYPDCKIELLRFVILMAKMGEILIKRGECVPVLIEALKIAKELHEWLFRHDILAVDFEKQKESYFFIKSMRQNYYHDNERTNTGIQNYKINEYFKRIRGKGAT